MWECLAAAYGLVDSERLWYRTSDETLVTDNLLGKSRLETTLYSRNVGGELNFVLVTQVENYIDAVNEMEMLEFEAFLQKRFGVGALDRNNFNFMDFMLSQDWDGTIILTKRSRIDGIE